MAISLGELIFSVGLEDGELSSGLKSANQKMESFANTADKTGKTLTTNLTLPIVGLGTAAIKMAADFEISSNKFAKAFEGASDEAALSVEKLNKEYGISNSLSTSLLANTGDLLKGFGATATEALGLSTEVQELASALAAYNGVPVKQASEAITSALLGETEAMKQLGVVISAASTEKQLAADGTEDLIGQELLLAEASARLTIAVSQSTDAIAAFDENTETAAFQTSALLGDLQDLGTELGTMLLPIFKELVADIRDGVSAFSELDDETKENILKMAGLVAAIGPAIIAIGKVTTAVKLLSSANVGVLAVITALAAVSAGVIVINKALKESEKIAEINKRINEGTADYADKLAVVNKQLEYEEKIRAKHQNTYDTNRGKAKENAKVELQASRDRINGILKQIAAIEYERKVELKKIQDGLDAEEKAALEKIRLAKAEADAEEAAQKAKDELIQKYVDQNKAVQDIIDSNKTEIDLIDDQIKSITKLALKDGKFRDDQLEAVKILEDKKQDILDKELKDEQDKNEAKLDYIKQFNVDYLKLEDTRQADLDQNRIAELEKAEQLGADKHVILEYYAELQKQLNQEIIDEAEAADKERISAAKTESYESALQIVDASVNFVIDITNAGIDGFTDSIAELDEEIDGINQTYDDQIDALSDLDEESQEYQDALADIEEARQAEIDVIEDQITVEENAAEALGMLGTQIEGIARGAEQFASGDKIGAIITWITTIFQPALEHVGEYIADNMTPILTELYDSFEVIGENLAEFLIPIFEILVEVFAVVFAALEPVSEQLARLSPLLWLIFDVLEPVFDILIALMPIIDLLLEVGLLPLTLAIGVLEIAIQPLIWVLEGLAFIVEKISDFFVFLGDALEDFISPVQDFFDTIVDGVSGFFGGVGDGIGDFFGGVGDFFGFDTGGFVTGSGATPIVVNESGQGEMMLSNSSAGDSLLDTFSTRIADNINSDMPISDSLFNRLSSSVDNSTMGTTGIGGSNDDSTVNIILDGKVIAASTVDLINNRNLTIDSRSIR